MASEQFVSLDEILEAQDFIRKSDLVIKTPLVKDQEIHYPELQLKGVKLFMKLENMQVMGSFKLRGVLNQLYRKQGDNIKYVTMSAGNYGTAFGYVLDKLNKKGLCIMPNTAQKSKQEKIKSFGVDVELCPSSELQSRVDQYVEFKNYEFCHPFDDRDIIAGYGSVGLEIIEDIDNFDVLLICCGGGGLTAGISCAVRHKLSNVSCRIYAVEPETSPTMFESFKANKAVSLGNVKSVATGLSPPYAGRHTFEYCKKYVNGVLLVSDAEILITMKRMYSHGIVAEPSGCAALAALLFDKVPDIEHKKVVVIVSGGNISINEMNSLIMNM